MSPEEFMSGLGQSESYDIHVTYNDVKMYTMAARDDNPLHFGEEGNVVPGGLITSFFLSNPKPGFFVRNYTVDFFHVTHFPATLTITRTMTKARVRKFGYVCTIEGTAKVDGKIVASSIIESFKPSQRIKEKYEKG